jgi:Flp pilus assembly protein TadG
MTRRDEAGQVTAFVVVFMVALIAVAGLVIDGGVALAAQRRAMNEAQAAARAGAEALNVELYRDQGVSEIDQSAARDAVGNYMKAADNGVTPDVHFVGTDTVVVDLSFTQSLNIFGSMTATGHGTARTAHGVVQEGS